LSAREYPNVIDIFFVLVSLRVEVKRGGVRHVTSGVIRNDGDIVTYLVLVRVALKWVKGITHCHVG
jgi:hypothetical protein